MRYLNELAYSVANALTSELKMPVYRENKYYAFILDDSCTLTVGDIKEVSTRVSLKPVFISVGSDTSNHKAKFFSRIFNSEHLYPKNQKELRTAISKCEFTVSDSHVGAYFSILAHKPSYLNMKNDSSRMFFAEIISIGYIKNIVIPYTKNRMRIIKKVRAKSSDFSCIINKIRNRIYWEILEEFTH